MTMWKDLSMLQRSQVMRMAMDSGIYDLKQIKLMYDSSRKFLEGGLVNVVQTNSDGIPEVTLPEVLVNGFDMNSPYGTKNGNLVWDNLTEAAGFMNEYINSDGYQTKYKQYGLTDDQMKYNVPYLETSNIPDEFEDSYNGLNGFVHVDINGYPLKFLNTYSPNIEKDDFIVTRNDPGETLVHEIAHSNPLFNTRNNRNVFLRIGDWFRGLFNNERNRYVEESPYYGMNYNNVPLHWKNILLPTGAIENHDKELNEAYSDLAALRYFLLKEGIYNSINPLNIFGEKEYDRLIQINKGRYSLPVRRFLDTHDKKRVIDAINDIAYNNNGYYGNHASYGGKLGEYLFQEGGDLNEMQYYQLPEVEIVADRIEPVKHSENLKQYSFNPYLIDSIGKSLNDILGLFAKPNKQYYTPVKVRPHLTKHDMSIGIVKQDNYAANSTKPINIELPWTPLMEYTKAPEFQYMNRNNALQLLDRLNYGPVDYNRPRYYMTKNGIYGPNGIVNTFKTGGSIHIKHPGRLTALKKRTGKTEAELWKTGSKAVRKMITFARNARKWKHLDGGYLDDIIWDQDGYRKYPMQDYPLMGIVGNNGRVDISTYGMRKDSQRPLFIETDMGDSIVMKPNQTASLRGNYAIEHVLQDGGFASYMTKSQIDNALHIWDYLIGLGFTPRNAAVIMGNSMLESSLNPNAKNPNSSARGYLLMIDAERKKSDAWSRQNGFDKDLGLFMYVNHLINNNIDAYTDEYNRVSKNLQDSIRVYNLNPTEANKKRMQENLNYHDTVYGKRISLGRMFPMSDLMSAWNNPDYDINKLSDLFEETIERAGSGAEHEKRRKYSNDILDYFAPNERELMIYRQDPLNYIDGKLMYDLNANPITYQYGGLIKPFSYTDIPVVRYGFGGYSYI